jgi:hypothetical protein
VITTSTPDLANFRHMADLLTLVIFEKNSSWPKICANAKMSQVLNLTNYGLGYI